MSSHDTGVVTAGLVSLVLAIVVGIGAAFGLAAGLVSIGSNASQVKSPLVTYNSQ